MLNRRWSIATDDVPVLSLFPTLFHGVWTIALGVGWIVLGRPGPHLSLGCVHCKLLLHSWCFTAFQRSRGLQFLLQCTMRLVHMVLTASATAVQMAAPRALATPSCWRAYSSAS